MSLTQIFNQPQGFSANFVLQGENSRQACIDSDNKWDRFCIVLIALIALAKSETLPLYNVQCTYCLKPPFHIDNHIEYEPLSYMCKVFWKEICQGETFATKKALNFLVN